MKPADRRRVAVVAGVLGVGATVAYPLLVFYGLTRYGTRAVAAVLLIGLVPLVVARLARTRRANLKRVGFVPLLVVALVAMSVVLDRAGLMLMVPVVLNGALAASFGATLRTRTPMIERFARLEHPDLTDGEVAWCRQWTRIWTGFFLANVVLVSALVALGWLTAWMYYTGLVAYLVMGVMFASEYLIRKARFGRFAGHPLDRALAWLYVRVGWVKTAPGTEPE